MGRREKKEVKFLSKAQKFAGPSLPPHTQKAGRLPKGAGRSSSFISASKAVSQYRPVQSAISSTGTVHSSRNTISARGVRRLYALLNTR